MEQVAAAEMPKHARARIELPVCLRWRGPLGMRLEKGKTADTSREGLSVRSGEPCEVSARVWLVFPFDTTNGAATQPEIPAQIVRTEKEPSGGCRATLKFEPSRRRQLTPSRKRLLENFCSGGHA